MPQLRVLLGFASASDHAVEERAQSVHDHLYEPEAVVYYANPAPPVTQAALATGIADFSSAIAAAADGGNTAIAIKDAKRAILIGLLRQLANYVQGKHGNRLDVLLLSGFEAVSTNNASSPLTDTSILDIIHDVSGQLSVRLSRVANVRLYELRYALLDANGTPGPWLDGGLHGSSRNLVVAGLTPGAVYQFQARALGGSTGHSNWSDIVSHRCM